MEEYNDYSSMLQQRCSQAIATLSTMTITYGNSLYDIKYHRDSRQQDSQPPTTEPPFQELGSGGDLNQKQSLSFEGLRGIDI